MKETCSIYVCGMTISCPLCQVIVESGTHHHCEIEAKTKPKKTKKVTVRMDSRRPRQ
jgi:ferredoxin